MPDPSLGILAVSHHPEPTDPEPPQAGDKSRAVESQAPQAPDANERPHQPFGVGRAEDPPGNYEEPADASDEVAPTDNENGSSLAAQVERLSGRYGEMEPFPAHLITNERWDEALPRALEELRKLPTGGVGLIIGSGAVASLAPDLQGIHPVLVDKNPTLLSFERQLIEALKGAGDLAELGDPKQIREHVANLVEDPPGRDADEGDLARLFAREAARLGDLHWSNPERLRSVVEALNNISPAFVAADLTNREFLEEFSALLGEQGKEITLANLTNVHEWVPESNMGFLRLLPFHPKPVILYSHHFGKNVPRHFEFTNSLSHYIRATRDTYGMTAMGRLRNWLGR